MTYYQKNKEHVKEKALNYYKNNRQKCIERMKVYNKLYYARKIKPVEILCELNKPKTLKVSFD